MVVEQLSDQFLIGSDILGSTYVSKIQYPHIYFTDGNNEYKVKMNQTTYPELKMTSIKSLTIQGNDSIDVSCSVDRFKRLETPIIASIRIPKLSIARMTYDGDRFIATINNKSRRKVVVSPSLPLMSLKRTTFNEAMPLDDYMDEKERRQSIDNFKIDGFYQPSITAFIEDKSNITEADKIDIPENVTTEDFIAMFEISHFKGEDRKHLIDILLDCKPAFSLHKYDIGKTSLVTMDIELIRPEEDKVQKYVPIAMHVIDKANEILDQMERYDIIRECHVPSPYCSNILVIPKKDKNAVRLLFDGRLLNYNTKRMPVAIITKAEILAHLVNKTHLTSLDFADAFFHIPLTEYAQNLTAFWTPNHAKKMCFNRAPQGLRNSPMYLKMLLDKVFFDLSENVLFYADDLLIATNGTLIEHLDFLRTVLERLVQAGLKLRPQKLLIARETINFLGMIFYKNTLSIPDLKLKAFQDLPIPNTAKRLKSALCAFSYYRHFVPNFAHLTRALHEKSSDKSLKKFVMTDDDNKQFKEIVDTICKNAKTYYPDNSKPFYVQTDASLYCAGGRLFQTNSNGDEMLIAAVSRTFTKTERNYTIYKKEALALLYTLRAMDFFLKFAPKLILLVDSKALTYIRLAKEGAPILLRFSLELSKYEADLIHIPGEQNEVSDMLSRQHKDIPAIEMEKLDKPTISEKDTIKIIDALTVPDDFQLTKTQLFSLLNGPSPADDTKKAKTTKSKAQPGLKQVKNTPLTLHKRKIKMPRTVKISAMTTRSKTKQKVSFAQDVVVHPPPTDAVEANNDIDMPQLINDRNISDDDVDVPAIISYSDIQSQCAVSNGTHISKRQFYDAQMSDPNIANSKEFIEKDGIIFKNVKGEDKIMLPNVFIPTLINLHHFVTPGIHKSKKQIIRDICSIYSVHLPSLNGILNSMIASCHVCQLFAEGKQHLKMLQLPRHSKCRLSWSIDLITDLPSSENGYKILLIAVDDFSNYMIAIPLHSTTSKELISALKNHIISPFGLPKFVRSDEQPGIYNSNEFFQFFQNMGIELQATAVASPFSNGRAETTIKIFKHAARKYFYQEGCINRWDEHVAIITTALNSSINSYGYAPEEIMFGHRLENNFKLIELPTDDNEISTESYIDSFMKRIAQIRAQYDSLKKAKHAANATFKNKHANERKFEIGDLVLHRQLQVSTGTASKYRPILTGPYVIQSMNKITATCKNLQTSRTIKAHFLNLVPYNFNEETLYPSKQTLEGALVST